MNFEKMTVKTREGFERANELASGMGNPELTAEHVLLALIDQDGGVASDLLQESKGFAAGSRKRFRSCPRRAGPRSTFPRIFGSSWTTLSGQRSR